MGLNLCSVKIEFSFTRHVSTSVWIIWRHTCICIWVVWLANVHTLLCLIWNCYVHLHIDVPTSYPSLIWRANQQLCHKCRSLLIFSWRLFCWHNWHCCSIAYYFNCVLKLTITLLWYLNFDPFVYKRIIINSLSSEPSVTHHLSPVMFSCCLDCLFMGLTHIIHWRTSALCWKIKPCTFPPITPSC